MPRFFGALTLVLMFSMVWTRAWLMRRQGLRAVHFGKADRTDFLILPFVLFYVYTVFAAAFGLPTVSTQPLFRSEAVAWAGAFSCLAGLSLLLWSLVSFGRSFRVGIDADQPGELTTTGVFGFSRNPIYVAFGLILLGEFLIFPNWVLLAYAGAGAWLFHRQVLREEAFLTRHYGQAYSAYRKRVRRYL